MTKNPFEMKNDETLNIYDSTAIIIYSVCMIVYSFMCVRFIILMSNLPTDSQVQVLFQGQRMYGVIPNT